MRIVVRLVLAFGLLTALLSPQLVSGAPQLGSLQLNGSTAFAEVGDSPDLNLTGDWTVEAWFKDEDPNGFNHDYRQILMKGDKAIAPDAPYYLLVGHNSILAGIRSGGQDFPIVWNLVYAGLDPNAWHHVAVTFRGDLNVLNLWLDGKHISFLQVAGHSTNGNTLALEIGRNGSITGKYWVGKLHDIRLWNVARQGGDISANYLTELSGAQLGLVANWKFDETSGGTAADSAAGHTAILQGGAMFAPIATGCGPGQPACPDLTVSQVGLPSTIAASPDAQVTLTVNVSNAALLTSAANIPAGTRLLRETLPTVLSATEGPSEGTFLTTRARPSPTLVNTVKYLSFQAPAGYQCTDPATNPTVVSCTATAVDSINPGDSRAFKFTLSLFDLAHPYVHIDDAVVGGTLPISVPLSAVALANPDGSVAESHLANNVASGTSLIAAPFIQFITTGNLGDCPLVMSPLQTGTDASGAPISFARWTCVIHMLTNQSSLAANLAPGALHLLTDSGPNRVDTDGLTATLGCATPIVPPSAASAGLSCTTSVTTDSTTHSFGSFGDWRTTCTSATAVSIPPNSDVQCQLLADVVSHNHLHFFFGRDMAPNSGSLNPEIIRFAAPGTYVRISFDLFGGSVGD